MDADVLETPKIGQGKPGPGRPKGLPNKTTALLKDAILKAATEAGGEEGGLVGYLKAQAIDNPGPFMALLGKVLPMPKQGASKAEVPMESLSISDWWVALRSLGFTRQDVMEASNKLFEREPAELKVEQRRQLVVSLTAK